MFVEIFVFCLAQSSRMSRYQPTNQRDHGGRSRNYDDRDRDNNYGSNNQRHHHSNYADNVRRFDSSRNFQRGGNDRGKNF